MQLSCVRLLLLSITINIGFARGEIECYPAVRGRQARERPTAGAIASSSDTGSERIRAQGKRTAEPVFRGHPKSSEQLWRERLLPEDKKPAQVASLVRLLHNITLSYLADCTPVVLYDSQIKSSEEHLFRDLFRSFPVTFSHGNIQDNRRNSSVVAAGLVEPRAGCLHFILFLTDVQRCGRVLSKQSTSRIVVVARSSHWAVQEYLASPASRQFKNLLIISPSIKNDDETLAVSYILYTHVLYTDGLGSSRAQVLASWRHGRFTRSTGLFPKKMKAGYAGHRFVIAVASQPPFTIKRSEINTVSGTVQTVWDGVEIRLMKLLAENNNFSIEFVEARELHLGPGDAVAKAVASGRADVGAAGLYTTTERFRELELSVGHSQDCAAFVTLTSTALPRYRAILGPFHWHVWVALTLTYLVGIFPLAFSDRHTLSHLLNNSGEAENMFWYVFGTFTNCFTFIGTYSWSNTDKVTTRLLIGWYWVFTIIITSCYTGSIIAFITLPMYPDTVDTVDQLLTGFFRIGTLGTGGWQRWLLNSSDSAAKKLVQKLEFVPDIETGMRNVTKAFFWPYAFIGSKAELEYLVQSNFSRAESKRAVLHVSTCFIPFAVALSFPNNSAHTAKFNTDLQTMLQTGIIDKITEDVLWQVQKSSGGGLFKVKPSTLSSNSLEEKGLTLEDTQGMFLLLCAGFLLASVALFSEWMGSFSRRYHQLKRRLLRAGTKDYFVPAARVGTERALPVDEGSFSAQAEESTNGPFVSGTRAGARLRNNYEGFDRRRPSSVEPDMEVEVFGSDEVRGRHAERRERDIANTASTLFGDLVNEEASFKRHLGYASTAEHRLRRVLTE